MDSNGGGWPRASPSDFVTSSTPMQSGPIHLHNHHSTSPQITVDRDHAPRSPQRPIQKMAQAVARCSAEASVYGRCIVADYNAVHKDKCLAEFTRLKDCYLVRRPRASRVSIYTR